MSADLVSPVLTYQILTEFLTGFPAIPPIRIDIGYV